MAAAFIVAKKPKEKLHQLQKTKIGSNTWFLDSCALCHLCNNQKLFSSTKAKNIDFVIIASQIIEIEVISTVSIPFAGKNNIKLYNVALALRWNSNRTLFRQFCESGITYHNNSKAMILMGNGEVIVQAKRDQNSSPSTLHSLTKQ